MKTKIIKIEHVERLRPVLIILMTVTFASLVSLAVWTGTRPSRTAFILWNTTILAYTVLCMVLSLVFGILVLRRLPNNIKFRSITQFIWLYNFFATLLSSTFIVAISLKMTPWNFLIIQSARRVLEFLVVINGILLFCVGRNTSSSDSSNHQSTIPTQSAEKLKQQQQHIKVQTGDVPPIVSTESLHGP
jgi:hypothetical protein